MKSFYGLLIVATLLLTESVFADEEFFEIGVLLCLSGECSEWGNASLKGLMLAQDEINARGGVLGRKIRFITEDTDEAVSAKNAVTGFKKLLVSNISYLIGPTWTPASMALAPMLAKNKKLLMISPSVGVASFNEASENIFNTMPHTEAISRELARYALRKGINSVGIFSSLQPWEKFMGDSFNDEFQKGGGKVLLKIEADPSSRNLRQESERLLSVHPEVIFLSNLGQSGIAAKTLRGLGYKGDFYAALLDNTRIEQAYGGLESTISGAYPEASKYFSKKFFERYSQRPSVSSDTSYDALYALITAVEHAKSFDAEKVARNLLDVHFLGASGFIQFDERGGVIGTSHFVTVKNGEIVELK